MMKYNDKANNCEYYKATINSFNKYILYCEKILNGKFYSDKMICENIFREKINSKHKFEEYLHKSIYISMDYVKYLKETVNEENIHIYRHTLMCLRIDLEWLIANFEKYWLKSADGIIFTNERKKNLNPSELYFAAKALFFIEENKNIQDLYLRGLKPAAMFYIRQLIEVYGRNILGYHSIEDEKGNLKKQFTQYAWKFIKEELKKDNPRIELPFDIDIVLSINKWANSFVHSTYLYNSYIQFYALKMVKMLFDSKRKKIRVYNGRLVEKSECSDIRITNYESLKSDFEKKLKEISKAEVIVNWMKVDDVGAYIISL